MSNLDALDLARIQFAFTVSFHIIFPAITIGLASFLAVLEGCWLKTGNAVYKDLYHFWSKIFAVNFGMGVVSGLVMAYEFGTNWARFSDFAGSVTGPLLTYEVLTAFFPEAGFLGVMLFGWDRVGRKLHFFATIMVAIGTLISMFWILSSNSWMQTPQGIEIVDGRVVPMDWFRIVFNPSFPYRLAHMALAAFLSTALFVGASAAWHLLRGRDTPQVRKMLSMAMWMIRWPRLCRSWWAMPTGSIPWSISRPRSQPSKGTGKIYRVRPRHWCCSACRTWTPKGPATAWRCLTWAA